MRQQVVDARHHRPQCAVWALGRFGYRSCGMLALFCQQGEVQQALGVVISRAQQLPARHVLEGGRDAPAQGDARRIQRLGVAQARQSRAVGPQQEDGLDQIATGLFDGQRRQLGVVK